MLHIDAVKPRLLTSIVIVDDLKNEIKKLNLCPAIVEEYPTWDSLEVDVQFLQKNINTILYTVSDMKITIDTSQDSHSDIKKAIRLLTSVVGHEHEVYSNAPVSMNVFDDPSPTVGPSEPVSDPEPAPTNAFASMFDSAPATNAEPEVEEEKKDTPQVELY